MLVVEEKAMISSYHALSFYGPAAQSLLRGSEGVFCNTQKEKLGLVYSDRVSAANLACNEHCA